MELAFFNPNIVDFTADTLHKSIIKLHRLNAACHTSPDDWADNLIEATKDLSDPEEQEQFIHYLSNPAGYEKKVELWDALEKFDRTYTDKRIWDEVEHDPFIEDLRFVRSAQTGHTKYMHVTHKKPVETIEEKIDSDDEKQMPEEINFVLDCEEEKSFQR